MFVKVLLVVSLASLPAESSAKPYRTLAEKFLDGSPNHIGKFFGFQNTWTGTKSWTPLHQVGTVSVDAPAFVNTHTRRDASDHETSIHSGAGEKVPDINQFLPEITRTTTFNEAKPLHFYPVNGFTNSLYHPDTKFITFDPLEIYEIPKYYVPARAGGVGGVVVNGEAGRQFVPGLGLIPVDSLDVYKLPKFQDT